MFFEEIVPGEGGYDIRNSIVGLINQRPENNTNPRIGVAVLEAEEFDYQFQLAHLTNVVRAPAIGVLVLVRFPILIFIILLVFFFFLSN